MIRARRIWESIEVPKRYIERCQFECGARREASCAKGLAGVSGEVVGCMADAQTIWTIPISGLHKIAKEDLPCEGRGLQQNRSSRDDGELERCSHF